MIERTLAVLVFLTGLAEPAAAAKTRVAVLDLESKNAPEKLTLAVSDLIRVELVKHGTYEVLDRQNMNLILKEQAFQQTGCTSAECAVEVGQILNCSKMFVGALSRIGGKFFLSAQRVDVETARVDFAVSAEAASEEELPGASAHLAAQMAAGESGAPKVRFFSGDNRQIHVAFSYGVDDFNYDPYFDGQEYDFEGGAYLWSSLRCTNYELRYAPSFWPLVEFGVYFTDWPVYTGAEEFKDLMAPGQSYRMLELQAEGYGGQLFLDWGSVTGLFPRRALCSLSLGLVDFGMTDRFVKQSGEESIVSYGEGIYKQLGTALIWRWWLTEFTVGVRFLFGDEVIFSRILEGQRDVLAEFRLENANAVFWRAGLVY